MNTKSSGTGSSSSSSSSSRTIASSGSSRGSESQWNVRWLYWQGGDGDAQACWYPGYATVRRLCSTLGTQTQRCHVCRRRRGVLGKRQLRCTGMLHCPLLVSSSTRELNSIQNWLTTFTYLLTLTLDLEQWPWFSVSGDTYKKSRSEASWFRSSSGSFFLYSCLYPCRTFAKVIFLLCLFVNRISLKSYGAFSQNFGE